MSASEFSIASFSPQALDGLLSYTDSPSMDGSGPSNTPWVTRVEMPDGMIVLGSVHPPTQRMEEMDGALAAAALADLLRPGWVEQARLRTRPVIRDGQVFRGFRLERTSQLFDPDGPPWTVRVFFATDLADTFDWDQAINALSQLHSEFSSYLARA